MLQRDGLQLNCMAIELCQLCLAITHRRLSHSGSSQWLVSDCCCYELQATVCACKQQLQVT